MINASAQPVPRIPRSSSMTPRLPQLKEQLRLAAMVLALLTGALLITGLWQHSLGEDSLLSAGRGAIFFLLALGLMGTRRLSVVLTALLCSAAATRLVSVGTTTGLTDWLEMLMLVICVSVLLLPTDRRGPEQPET